MIENINLPANQKLGNIRPFVTINLMSIKNDPLFLAVNRRLLNVRIQVIVPPLSALLTCSPTNSVNLCKLLSNECPALGPILAHELYNGVVFL